MSTEWMSRQDAADYLRVSKATIDRHRRNRRLPRYHIGGKPVFRREDLDKLAVRDSDDQPEMALAS